MKADTRTEQEEPVPYSALLEVAPLLEEESEPSGGPIPPRKALFRMILALGRFLLIALILAGFAFCAFGRCTAPGNAMKTERGHARWSHQRDLPDEQAHGPAVFHHLHHNL